MPSFNYWEEEKEAKILAGQNDEAKQTPPEAESLENRVTISKRTG